MQRRTLLALGGASAVALVLGGGAVAWLQPGLHESKLTRDARSVFAGVARAVLEGTLPHQPAAQRGAVDNLLDRIDLVIGSLAPHAQEELSQLLALLSTTAGRRLVAGLADPWHLASAGDVRAALQGMRFSSISLRQQAYQALHDIVGGAYFSDASTWAAIGYPGPVQV